MENREWRYQELSKKKSSFELWLKHHTPLLEYLYDVFLQTCIEHEMPIERSIESRKDFYRMMYEESNGELVDKRDYLSFYPEEEKKED